MVEVRLSAIRLDGGTQPRRAMDQAVVEEYAAAMRAGASFPPPVVFGTSRSESYFLADGFHRVTALLLLERDTVLADLREGTRRDAILYSVGANASHGLRRTREDARRAVATLLRDEEWGRRSDRWIAEQTHVSDKTVARVRAELGAGAEIPQLREGRNGKSYTARRPEPSTVVLDGDPGPDDEEYTSPEQTSLQIDEEPPARDEEGSAQDAANRALERLARHAEAGTLAPAPRSGRLPPGDGAGFDESGPVSAVKGPSWREVLGLPPGALDAAQILEAHERLCAEVPVPEGLDRALALGLSQWDSRAPEALEMRELFDAAIAARSLGSSVRVLEPSAGTGALLRELRTPRAGLPPAPLHLTAYEIDPRRAEVLRGLADEVLVEDFLGAPRPRERFDVALMNPPYESGADGRFLARAMEVSDHVIALLRLNALTGADRWERVWSQVASGAWSLEHLRILASRPGFDGPGDHGARSDYVIVHLARPRATARPPSTSRTRVEWVRTGEDA